MTNTPDVYLTVQEVANIENVSERTIRQWVRRNKVRARRDGGRLLVNREDAQEQAACGEHGLSEGEAEKRTRKMVEIFLLEGATLDDIGRVYGLTRERVRQIMSKPWGSSLSEIREALRANALQDSKVRCVACGGPRSSSRPGSTTCSRACRTLLLRYDLNELRVCDNCNREYHPYRNWKAAYMGRAHYCSINCYKVHGLGRSNNGGSLKVPKEIISMIEDARTYSIKDISKIFGISRPLIQYFVFTGKLPTAGRFAGKGTPYKIRGEDLKEFLRASGRVA